MCDAVQDQSCLFDCCGSNRLVMSLQLSPLIVIDDNHVIVFRFLNHTGYLQPRYPV